jgi:hypothetical protein
MAEISELMKCYNNYDKAGMDPGKKERISSWI